MFWCIFISNTHQLDFYQHCPTETTNITSEPSQILPYIHHQYYLRAVTNITLHTPKILPITETTNMTLEKTQILPYRRHQYYPTHITIIFHCRHYQNYLTDTTNITLLIEYYLTDTTNIILETLPILPYWYHQYYLLIKPILPYRYH